MKKALLALAVLIGSTAVAEAQVKNRWRLQWSNEKPQIYTYRTPNDQYENYWFFTYTLENLTDEIIPLIVNVQLYTEAGKDLQNDFRKVDDVVIKEELNHPKKSEPLKFGHFYANVIDPEAEFKIIEYHAKIGNRSDGIIRESIEAFKKGFTQDPPDQFRGKWKKGDRLYLNPREIRDQRYIHPGQRIGGIAIYKEVDPRAHLYEIQVAGLVDIVKITAVNEDECRMEYEPQTLKISYERQGDAFEIERDVLYRLAKKEYAVQKIGPIASKDTVDKLVNALVDTLKKELEWKDKDLKPEDIAKKRAADGIDSLDTGIMAMVFRLATDKDFGYDPARSVLENERAVWRIHEWWLTNRFKLIFNEISNRFEIKDDVLPGTVIEK